MWFHPFAQNLQYHSQSVEQKKLSKSSCTRLASITYFLLEINEHNKLGERKTMPLTLFFHSILYDECTSLTTSITYILFFFAITCETEETLKKKNLLSVVLGEDVMFVYKQTERKCHLLSVINPMKFFEALFQITYVTNFLLFIELCQINCTNICCLLSLSGSDVVWGSVVLLTPYQWETWLHVSLQW